MAERGRKKRGKREMTRKEKEKGREKEKERKRRRSEEHSEGKVDKIGRAHV